MATEIAFEEFTEADIPELTAVMTRAFDDDAQKHLGQERGGPPGYDNGDFFREWLFGYEQTDGYKIVREGKAIGAVIVWILPEGHNVLGAIFVDPGAQDRGVGTRIWQFVETRYPQTKSWRLVTPTWATKNHYFYEAKCGFERVESDPIAGAPEGEFVYRKEMACLGPQKNIDIRLRRVYTGAASQPRGAVFVAFPSTTIEANPAGGRAAAAEV